MRILELALLGYTAMALTLILKGMSHLYRVLHRIESRVAIAIPLNSDQTVQETIRRDAEYIGID